MSFLSRLRTPTLANTGSTARDHLASERTFLAWIRTGLGFVALGIAVERFSQLDIVELLSTLQGDSSIHRQKKTEKPPETELTNTQGKDHLLVEALLGTGTGSIVYGTSRYFSNLRLLEKGLFKPAYFGAAGLSIGVAALSAAVYHSAMRSKELNRA
jgi:uncharacterized membrane protein YidH (DUF202 family)